MKDFLQNSKKFSVSILFCLTGLMSDAGVPISGIINSYASVTGIAGTTLTVSTTVGFIAGDKVMVIQMKGVTIDGTNSSTYGNISNYGNCGNFEYGFIASLTGTTITLQNSLVKGYTPGGNNFVQVITVPRYCDVDIVDTLKAQDWNGTTGGVLVFESGGTVTMFSDIKVTGAGFRPQPWCAQTNPINCGALNWYYNPTNCNSGWKGEAIAEYAANAQKGGRANLANGGGGGNSMNNGGAGGGNYGVGGVSGWEDNVTCGGSSVQALGGLALNYTTGKMFLGGAGGTGCGTGGVGFGGTAGGGIVVIAANIIVPNGHTIRSEGKDQTGITSDAGAGGGGSGGVVCLDIPTITGLLNINVDGGDGGSDDNTTSRCTGPGGGGGAGVLWVSGGALNPNIVLSANGGKAGLTLEPTSACFNTTYGAADGAPGAAIFNYPPHVLPLALVPPDLGNDTIACPLEQILLDPGAGFSSWLWQDGSTNPTYTAVGPGTYTVQIKDNLGCIGFDTIIITAAPNFSFTIATGDTTVCFQQPVSINGGSYSTWTWQDGSTSQFYTTSDTGTFSVTVTDAIGCIGTATYDIHNFPPFTFTIGTGDTILCYGQPVTIDAGPNYALYLWPDLSTNQTFTTTTAGSYTVNVQDAAGCVGSSTYDVFNFPGAILDLGVDTAMCEGDSIVLDAGIYPTYLWQDGSQNQSITITDPGTYFVTVDDFNGCVLKDTIVVLPFYPVPPQEFIDDATICIPDTITIHGPAGYAAYEWNDGSTLNYLLVTKPGAYSLTISNSFTCHSKDSFLITLKCATNIWLPDAFTPNGDGINDIFLPIGYNITNFHMMIFNRWGQLVFETFDADKGWNGASNGVPAEIGAYPYYAEWAGFQDGVSKDGILKGNVTLIR